MSPIPRNRFGDPNPYANPFGNRGSLGGFGVHGGGSSTSSSTTRGMPQNPNSPAGGFGGGGFGTAMPPAGGGGGAGGESVDTGGLPAGPETRTETDGGFGTGNTWHYSPTTNIHNRTNRYTSSYYRGGDVTTDRSRTTNIDNSQTTMGQGQRVQRQKTKAQLNPFQSISPDKEQKMIGDPSNPMTQLRIMRGG